MDVSYYKELVDISSENMKIHYFFKFVQKVYDLPDCKKGGNCGIENFVCCLKDAFLDPDKSYNE